MRKKYQYGLRGLQAWAETDSQIDLILTSVGSIGDVLASKGFGGVQSAQHFLQASDLCEAIAQDICIKKVTCPQLLNSWHNKTRSHTVRRFKSTSGMKLCIIEMEVMWRWKWCDDESIVTLKVMWDGSNVTQTAEQDQPELQLCFKSALFWSWHAHTHLHI